jgi:hypothetical protein
LNFLPADGWKRQEFPLTSAGWSAMQAAGVVAGEFQDALQKSHHFFPGHEVVVRQGHSVRQRFFQNQEKSARA